MEIFHKRSPINRIGITLPTKESEQIQLESERRQKNQGKVNWNRLRDKSGKTMSIGIIAATIAGRQSKLESSLRKKNNGNSNWNCPCEKGKTAPQIEKNVRKLMETPTQVSGLNR